MSFRTSILVALAVLFDRTFAAPSQQPPQDNNEWDAIIVGAGPAGIVTAERMSEAGKRTLLLEQGGGSYYITGGRERPNWLSNTELSRVDVPGLYQTIFTGSDSLLCGDKLPGGFAGCTIGGSSAINAELFSQPPASDFDTYYPQKWKSANVSNAISKTRAKQPFTKQPSLDGKYYGQTGHSAVKKWLVDGAHLKDLDINETPNDKDGIFGRPYWAFEKGQRSGPVKTYLQSALKRPNFSLRSGVQVKRVQRSGGRVTGVVAIVNGKETTFKLCKTGRAILSGGAFFSPQLLMLSGIGDPASLQKLQENKLLNMPSTSWINNTAVGDRLYDNPNTFIVLQSSDIQSYTYNYTSPIQTDRNFYLKSRSGPYASAGQTSLFWDSVAQADGSRIFVQGTTNTAGSFDFTSPNSITLNIYATSGAKSKSRVVLNEKGLPSAASDFLFSSPADADAVATVIHKLFQSLPGTGLTPLNIPAKASKADVLKYITTPSKYTKGYVNHWSGSCKIGTCVDLDTKVLGTENLHVVDSSITEAFTANPMFGIMVVAERASELILALDRR